MSAATFEKWWPQDTAEWCQQFVLRWPQARINFLSATQNCLFRPKGVFCVSPSAVPWWYYVFKPCWLREHQVACSGHVHVIAMDIVMSIEAETRSNCSSSPWPKVMDTHLYPPPPLAQLISHLARENIRNVTVCSAGYRHLCTQARIFLSPLQHEHSAASAQSPQPFMHQVERIKIYFWCGFINKYRLAMWVDKRLPLFMLILLFYMYAQIERFSHLHLRLCFGLTRGIYLLLFIS